MLDDQRRLTPALLILIGFLTGMLALAGITSPHIETVLPAPGELAVPATARLRIKFDQAMDINSLVSHLRITPEIDGRFYWDANWFIFEPDHPWPSDETVVVELRAGARSQRVLPLWRGRRWEFDVGRPRLIYLWPADGKADLYMQELGQESSRTQLTRSAAGIEDFSTSPDGSDIAYTAISGDGGTSLHILNLIDESDRVVVDCGPASPCRAPAISPDGRWMAFEEHHLQEGVAGRLELVGRQVVVADLDQSGARLQLDLNADDVWGPAWSPAGWLTYYDENLDAVVIVDISDEGSPVTLQYIPNGLGPMGTWSPDGSVFVAPEIVFAEASTGDRLEGQSEEVLFYSHLYRIEPESGRTVDISPGDDIRVEDAIPRFHPDGELLAFTRKYLEESRWTPGRQIWLLDTVTQQTRSLTTVPSTNYSALTWSPDGNMLAFMRRSFGDLSQPPEIGWFETQSGTERLLVQNGYLPAWIP